MMVGGGFPYNKNNHMRTPSRTRFHLHRSSAPAGGSTSSSSSSRDVRPILLLPPFSPLFKPRFGIGRSPDKRKGLRESPWQGDLELITYIFRRTGAKEVLEKRGNKKRVIQLFNGKIQSGGGRS